MAVAQRICEAWNVMDLDEYHRLFDAKVDYRNIPLPGDRHIGPEPHEPDDAADWFHPLELLLTGKPFAHETYDRPEEYAFEEPVPTGFLAADSLTVVDVGVDKYYVTPDGTKLTVLLLEAGFVLQGAAR